MSNDRGVFRLGAYRRAQVEGQGVDLDDVWVPPAPIATSNASYMVGGLMNEWNSGNASDISSQTDKITYSSSTTSRLPGANLDNPMYGGVGMSSLLAMYSGGGPNVPGLNPNETNVRKLTYSSETFALLPSASGLKCEPKESTQGVGDASNFGYFFGATLSGTASYTQKFTFAYESSSRVPGADLPYSFYGATAAGDQEKAYVTGGSTGPWSSFKTNVTKFTYSGETMADVPGLRLSDDKYKGYGEAAAANSQYIWYAGGSQTSPQGGAIKGQTTVSRIDMSADTIQESLPSTQLTYPTFKHGGVDNGSDGYFAGGNSWNGPSPGGPYSSANKLTFSNGTMAATPGANLTQAKSLMQTAGPRQYSTPSPAPGGSPYRWRDGFKEDDLKKGYYSGGSSNGYSTVTQKVDYATDQTSLVPGGYLPDSGGQFAGVNSNSVKTIMTGGEPSGDPFMQFVYATETASNISGSMPGKRTRNNDMGYGTETAGYVTGGEKEPSSPAAYYSSTQKIEFATDTASEVPGANSNWTMRYAGAFGNVDHTLGYVVGGQNFPSGPSISRIQKMTYSTETMANTPANMQNGYFNLGTTSGPDAGYIYSKQEYPGWTSNGAIEKFVYATDSRTTVPQPTYYPRYGANGTGNSTNGYYGGGAGAPSPSDNYRRLLKLNFSTGVGQDMPSSLFPYNEGVYRSAAGSAVSRKKSPKGAPVPTPTPGYDPGNYELAAGVPNHGYYMGGNGPNQYGSTNSMKMNFATDTLSTGVQLSEKYRSGTQGSGGKTASSPSHAYVIQGLAPSNTGNTYVRKIQYSNDTGSNAPNTPSQPSWGSAIAGRTTNLYKAGGHDHANIPLQTRTGILKLTYASDTWNQISQGNAGYSNPSGWPRQSFASGGTQEYALWSQSSPNDYRSSISKFTYATDTGVMNIPGATYPNTEQTLQVGNSNDTHWYMARGNTPSGPFQSKISKFTFSTDTWEFGTLTDSTYDYGSATGSAAINNGMFAGYWAGGHYDQQDATSTMKLTYSSETVAKGPNIPSGRYSPSASSGGGGAEFTGTSVQEWGNGGTRVPNVV